MSLEYEDQNQLEEAPKSLHEFQKESKISYTREFLFSLSQLDICMKLPRGFDHSILSEFEDASHDRQRVSGSLLQGYRRTDYSSSPPTSGDPGNYSRGTYGRWESHSSARSDKDSDSQSDWDSESGRWYGNQTQRSSQNTEHDGLLGSGSFARPSGYGAGISATNAQADEQHQLKKSNEPYHPPRPYKAMPHARRETIEYLDDETFGSAEVTSQDRAEEEKRRRAAFESMRKEQHKALQEKQKSDTGKLKDDVLADLIEQTKEENKTLERTHKSDGSGTLHVPSLNGLASSSSQVAARRPVVPPGFASTILEKNSGPKSAVHPHEKEVGKQEHAERLLITKANPLQNGNIDNQKVGSIPDDNMIHATLLNKNGKIIESSYGFEISNKKLGLDENGPLDGQESLGSDEIDELNSKKMKGDKFVSDSNPNQDNSTSILDKLFGSAALTVNTGVPSGFIEHRDSKPDEMRIPVIKQSSKFARWFLEEDKKPNEDMSSSRPTGLLSLIVSGEKGGPHILDANITHQSIPDFTISTTSEISDQLNSWSKPEVVPSVLTCEDLEQAILSEYSEKSSVVDLPAQDSHVPSAEETLQPKANIDNQASQHLLSLLQKGPNLKETRPSTSSDVDSSDKQGNTGTVPDKPREANETTMNDSGKTITLETLFGTQFMKELQSVGAPVSVHRAPLAEDNLFTSSIDGVGSNKGNHENNILSSNPNDQPKFDKVENWLKFDDPHIEVNPSNRTAAGGFDEPIEIGLPEEESLIMVNSMFGNTNKTELMSSSAAINIEEKLAALNVGFNPARGGPFDLMVGSEGVGPESQYHNNMHAQSSAPHGRPLFRSLDPSHHPAAHINNPQMKFMGSDSILQCNSPPPNNQFMMPRPPFQQLNAVGSTRFDIPGHRQMLQQMQMQGNYPPCHLVHELSRGEPIHPHLSKNAAGGGFMQEPNPMQGFPFANRQPNVNGLGLSGDGGATGSNHPEGLERFMGMDVRAIPKQQQINLPAYGQRIYGHELARHGFPL